MSLCGDEVVLGEAGQSLRSRDGCSTVECHVRRTKLLFVLSARVSYERQGTRQQCASGNAMNHVIACVVISVTVLDDRVITIHTKMVFVVLLQAPPPTGCLLEASEVLCETDQMVQVVVFFVCQCRQGNEFQSDESLAC